MNVTIESLKEKHGDKAESVFREIADRGGFGNIPSNYVGGLDIFSVIQPANKVLSEKDKDRIAELSGITRKDADMKAESGKVTTLDQTADATPKFPKPAIQ